MLITVDPNVRGCGVAAWERGTLPLLWASYVKNPHGDLKGRAYFRDTALGQAVWRHIIERKHPHMPVSQIKGIIERPRVYPGMPKTDLNDLIDVATVGAACAAYFADAGGADTVFPSEWKGQLAKKAMLERIWSKLSDAERAVVQKTNKSDTEDILDAVGIGLWHFGRLSVKVYPGAE